MGFGQAIGSFFKNYVNFRGRARRSEFWFAELFMIIVEVILGTAVSMCANAQSSALMVFTAIEYIWSLAILLPSLSLMVRRLHDIGKAWPWIFMYCIPVAGVVFTFIYNCTDSAPDNQWGPNPKGYTAPMGGAGFGGYNGDNNNFNF